MRVWQSPEGINWVIDVDLAGSSNAMVIFRHPGDKNGRLDKYNWFISSGPEARSVTSRLSKAKVLESLSHPGIPRYLASFEQDTEQDRAFFLVQVGVGRTRAGDLPARVRRTVDFVVERLMLGRGSTA